MKLKVIFLAMAFGFCSVCCSKSHVLNKELLRVIDRDEDESSHFVTERMVDEFVRSRHPETKANAILDYSITPYIRSRADTLFFFINYGYEVGWQIISSDTRTPAIIAEGNQGIFSIDRGSPGHRLWIDYLANVMEVVRQSPDSLLAFSQEEIATNKSVWSNPSHRGLSPPEIDHRPGRWYSSTTTEVIVVDSLEHLTSTQWSQHNPYNYYCPIISGTSQRAYAGCSAIAGAQMLYYLHGKYGLPETMCESVSGNAPNYSFDDWTSSVWEEMGTLNEATNYPIYCVPESALIFYVGNQISTDYQNESEAITEYLVDSLFTVSGYDCVYSPYNSFDVTSSLQNDLPVVVRADTQETRTDSSGGGHAFLIDGYKITESYSSTLHYFMYDDGMSEPELPNYWTYSYSPPHISAVKMNWGWASQWSIPRVNDGWYSLIDQWVTNFNGGYDTYGVDVYMIHDFSVSE